MLKKINLYNMPLNILSEIDGIYYSVSENIDYFEVESMFKSGIKILGNELSFLFYPNCMIYKPFILEYGVYFDNFSIKYLNKKIYFTKVDFNKSNVFVYEYDVKNNILSIIKIFDLNDISLYNLRFSDNEVMLFSENVDKNIVEIYYPEKFNLKLEERESFLFRLDDKFYFSKWVEENYKYYEKYVIKDSNSNILDEQIGYIQIMPDGKYIIV